mgnify:CR=1 FL=1
MTEIAKKTATDGQLKDLLSIAVTSWPNHEDVQRNIAEYWCGHKRELGARLREVVLDVPDDNSENFPNRLLKYTQFYREVLKIKVDFSDIDLSRDGKIKTEGLTIVPVISELLAQDILELLQKHFPTGMCLNDYGSDLPKCLKQEGPKRPKGHYAVLLRDSALPDIDARLVLADEVNPAPEHDVVYTARYYKKPPPFPADLLSIKEYLLFVAFEVWTRNAVDDVDDVDDVPCWYDYDSPYFQSVGNGKHKDYPGTSFPVFCDLPATHQVNRFLHLGTLFSRSGQFVLEASGDVGVAWARRVRVLPSLRTM